MSEVEITLTDHSLFREGEVVSYVVFGDHHRYVKITKIDGSTITARSLTFIEHVRRIAWSLKSIIVSRIRTVRNLWTGLLKKVMPTKFS